MMSDAIKALVKAQSEMGAVLKNQKNPHLKSKYADLGAVMDACFGALHNNGFAVMQPGGADEHGHYVETVFAHESGQEFRSKCYLVVGKQDMQGVGSAWTYARRYGLLGMAGLAPEDDDGEGTKRPPAPPREPAKEPAKPADAKARADRMVKSLDDVPDAPSLQKLMGMKSFNDAYRELQQAAPEEWHRVELARQAADHRVNGPTADQMMGTG